MKPPRYASIKIVRACICARFALIDTVPRTENVGTQRWNSGRTRNSFHSRSQPIRSRQVRRTSMNRETGSFDNIPSARWVLTVIGMLYIYIFTILEIARWKVQLTIDAIYIENSFPYDSINPAFRIVYYVTGVHLGRSLYLIECYVSSIFLVNRKVIVKTATA